MQSTGNAVSCRSWEQSSETANKKKGEPQDADDGSVREELAV